MLLTIDMIIPIAHNIVFELVTFTFSHKFDPKPYHIAYCLLVLILILTTFETESPNDHNLNYELKLILINYL